MMEEQGRHPDDEQVEQYSLGVLPAGAIPEFEQHILICHDCQDRVARMDAEIQGMQAAAREFRAQEVLKRRKAGSCG
jgi:anti-sigma factor ChrR (cupin superfamily)